MYQPDPIDWGIIEQIQDGLPFTHRPYALIGARLGLSESDLIARIQNLQTQGIIKRFGIVVHHRRLGYTANGMVVWDIPEAQIADIAAQFVSYDGVTLCYQRPRCLPDWPYNLFTMIHGQDRAQVQAHVQTLAALCPEVGYTTLFSRRCFKQCGARYHRSPLPTVASAVSV